MEQLNVMEGGSDRDNEWKAIVRENQTVFYVGIPHADYKRLTLKEPGGLELVHLLAAHQILMKMTVAPDQRIVCDDKTLNSVNEDLVKFQYKKIQVKATSKDEIARQLRELNNQFGPGWEHCCTPVISSPLPESAAIGCIVYRIKIRENHFHDR